MTVVACPSSSCYTLDFTAILLCTAKDRWVLMLTILLHPGCSWCGWY